MMKGLNNFLWKDAVMRKKYEPNLVEIFQNGDFFWI